MLVRLPVDDRCGHAPLSLPLSPAFLPAKVKKSSASNSRSQSSPVHLGFRQVVQAGT
jgi:hypothetical protein